MSAASANTARPLYPMSHGTMNRDIVNALLPCALPRLCSGVNETAMLARCRTLAQKT